MVELHCMRCTEPFEGETTAVKVEPVNIDLEGEKMSNTTYRGFQGYMCRECWNND